MKKKIFVCAIMIICLTLAAYSTIAYFTYEDTATNTITAGNIKIDLEELAIPEGGGDPVPFKDVINVMPGSSVSKIVQVKNIGSQDAWVRISLSTAIELAEGVTGEADLSLISYDISDKWTEKDGYYYYSEVLAPGETSVPLFENVIFSKNMGNLYQDAKAVITVMAQATQVANNGANVFEAEGWPSAN